MDIGTKKKTTDLKSGPVFSGLLRFSLPIFLGTIVTQLYSVADSVIVGQFVGTDALSAVSATDPIHTFMNLFFVSLSTGTVTISHHVGENNPDGVQRAVNTVGFLTLVSGLFLTAVGIPFSGALLEALDTPEAILNDATVYSQIIFVGILANLSYQMGNGILRSLGDSKWPFYFLVLCSVLNVVLDLVLVLVFHLGVPGVAAATSFSQLVSAIGVIWRINFGGYGIHIGKGVLKLDKVECKRVLSIGLPAAVQNVGNSIAAVFVQSSVNYFAETMIAANNIVNKINNFVDVPIMALSTGLCTFVAQNMGCRQMERTKKGINDSMLFLTVLGAAMTGGLILLRFQLPKIFTDDAEVIRVAADGLFIMSFQCTFLGVDRVLVNAMRGADKAVVPMITAQFSVFTRIPLTYLLGVCCNNYKGVFYALVIAAFTRAAAIGIYYYCGGWKNAVKKFERTHFLK